MAPKKKATGKRGPRGPSISFKDVAMAFLSYDDEEKSVEAVSKLNAHPRTIRKAITHLNNLGKNGDLLASFVPAARQGPRAPVPGDERDYKAQKVGNSGTFLRLPLDPLGVKKGAELHVTFYDDKIVVTKSAEGEGSTKKPKLRSVA